MFYSQLSYRMKLNIPVTLKKILNNASLILERKIAKNRNITFIELVQSYIISGD